VAEEDFETAPVFYSVANDVGAPLYFANEILFFGSGIDESAILSRMDLRGPCQEQNLHTVLVALDVLAKTWKVGVVLKGPSTLKAIERTAELTGLRGRWEKLQDHPEVVCDIAHNPPALEVNFARLRELQRGNAAESAGSGQRAESAGSGQRAESAGSGQSQGRPLIIVYGIMADKDLAGIAPLMPEHARFILAAPAIPRALPAEELQNRLKELRPDLTLETAPSIATAVERALEIAESLATACRSASEPFIYIGGSTFVVTEAIEYFNARKK
jgi:dihydrofolate synthase/folylpolyglutamate synthase